MSRSFLALALSVVCSLATLPHAVSAAPAASHGPIAMFGDDGEGDDGDKEAGKVQIRKDAGSIEGEVVSVDYRTSHFSVKSGNTVYDVTVLPSTDFRGKNDAFRGFTDIKKGAHVNVMLSQRASSYVAQIIQLH